MVGMEYQDKMEYQDEMAVTESQEDKGREETLVCRGHLALKVSTWFALLRIDTRGQLASLQVGYPSYSFNQYVYM